MRDFRFGITIQEFVDIWNAAKSASEVREKFSLTPQELSTVVGSLRMFGVELKRYKQGRRKKEAAL